MIDLTDCFINAINIAQKGTFSQALWHKVFADFCNENGYVTSWDITEENWGEIYNVNGKDGMIYRSDIPLVFIKGEESQSEYITNKYCFEFVWFPINGDELIRYSIDLSVLKDYFGYNGQQDVWEKSEVDPHSFVFSDLLYMTH